MRTNSINSFVFLISNIHFKSQTLKDSFFHILSSTHNLHSFLFFFSSFPFIFFSFLSPFPHQLHHHQVVADGATIGTISNHPSLPSLSNYIIPISLSFKFFILFIYFYPSFFFYFPLCTATNVFLSSSSFPMVIDCYISICGLGDR